MSTSTTAAAGLNIEDLRQRVANDLKASNELQDRIDRIRKDAAAGGKPSDAEVNLVGVEHKQIGRDIVRRVEQIEEQKSLTAADRNMLQALTARLGVHDLQSARIAELGDLLIKNEWLEAEDLPGGSTPSLKARVASSDRQLSKDSQTQEAMHEQRATIEPLLEPACGSTRSSQSSELTAASSLMSPLTTGSWHVVDEDDFNENDSPSEEDDNEANTDKSSWPLLYRIIKIHPNTPDHVFNYQLESCYKSLALRHDPARFPNDESAPERWAACNKAYAILADPGRRRFYDLHGKAPKDLQDFDISKLSLSD